MFIWIGPGLCLKFPLALEARVFTFLMSSFCSVSSLGFYLPKYFSSECVSCSSLPVIACYYTGALLVLVVSCVYNHIIKSQDFSGSVSFHKCFSIGSISCLLDPVSFPSEQCSQTTSSEFWPPLTVSFNFYKNLRKMLCIWQKIIYCKRFRNTVYMLFPTKKLLNFFASS